MFVDWGAEWPCASVSPMFVPRHPTSPRGHLITYLAPPASVACHRVIARAGPVGKYSIVVVVVSA